MTGKSLALIIGAGAILLLGGGTAAAATLNSSGGDMSGGISNDPSTWPSGDRIWDCCHAIAMAEGANIAGSNPDRLNNPGDISDGFNTYGGEQHSGSNITHFPDKQTGWQWLYDKISRHVNGQSLTYPAGLTIDEFAQKYAANWQAWENNVGSNLGVDPTQTSFSDYVNG